MYKFLLILFTLPLWGQFQASFPSPTPNTAFASLLMDASAEKVAYIFQVPKTGTLNNIRFRTGTVTTGDTLKVSFQNVSTTNGDPDGSIDEYRTIVVNSSDDNVMLTTGIISSDGTDGGVKRSVTQGDYLAVVFEFDSFVAGAINIAGLSINSVSTNPYSGGTYADHYTAAWAKSTAVSPILALEYTDGSYNYTPGVYVMSVSSTLSFASNNATQDEVALRFTVPVTTKVKGGYFMADFDAATDAVLYDSGGTALATVSIDPDIRIANSDVLTAVYFASEITLSPDTTYRWTLKPTTTTNITVRYFDVAAAAVMGQMEGGTNVYWDARVDAGAWTSTTTRRPYAGLFISDIPAATGGSGSGGFRVTQ